MTHYETDGSCCCDPSGCCPSEFLFYGCDTCDHSITITLPSVFTDDCACWNGATTVVDQDYDPIDDRYYCTWGTSISVPIPGCPDGIKDIGASISCDEITCEWVLIVVIGTQGLFPCSEIDIEARVPQTTGCPPLGAWPITSWAWGTGVAGGCDPCAEIDLTGEDLILS